MEKGRGGDGISLVERLDRLDRLVYHLEEKQILSQRFLSSEVFRPVQIENLQRSSAAEEVPSKGTLMERVAALESRVLQLSLDAEETYKSYVKSCASSHLSYGRDEEEKVMVQNQAEPTFSVDATHVMSSNAKPNEVKALEEGHASDRKKSKRKMIVLRFRSWLTLIKPSS